MIGIIVAVLIFAVFAAFGGMWSAGIIPAEASNKMIFAVAGVSGVAGSLVAGYTHIYDVMYSVFMGQAVGWGSTFFTVGVLVVGLVWIVNMLFTANHEPIL